VRPELEVFADVACPFAYVGLLRVLAERDRAGSDTALWVRAWPLELVNGKPIDPAHVAAEVEALRRDVSPDLFRGFDPTVFPATSIPAFGLVAAGYAASVDVGEALSIAVRAALFETAQPIDDDGVLRDLGRAFGVVPLGRAAAEAAVRRDWDAGKARGVRGSPHFFSGADHWFCPALAIEKRDDGYHARIAGDRVEAFLANVL
jgi:predicted DsbA family dithiol-disulfide isomerase